MDGLLKKTSKKEKIMDAALKVFAKKGFQETTISEISKTAAVSEATIYEYFKGKEDLLFSIIETASSHSFHFLNEIFPFIRDPESRIRAIVQLHLSVYQNNPNYGAVGMLELKTNRRFHLSKAYKPVQKVARLLLECIKEGIESGVFRKDLDPYLMRSVLLGTIEHISIRHHLIGSPADISVYVDPIINLTFDGARVKSAATNLNISLQLSDGKIISKQVTSAKNL